jgi:hypothetical protein
MNLALTVSEERKGFVLLLVEVNDHIVAKPFLFLASVKEVLQLRLPKGVLAARLSEHLRIVDVHMGKAAPPLFRELSVGLGKVKFRRDELPVDESKIKDHVMPDDCLLILHQQFNDPREAKLILIECICLLLIVDLLLLGADDLRLGLLLLLFLFLLDLLIRELKPKGALRVVVVSR